MSKTFLQGDYGAVDGVSMKNSGCGPTAIADIVYNKDTKITPPRVALWMKNNGYWSDCGATRQGITKTLKKYGFQSLYFTPEHTGNTEWVTAFEMIKATHEGRCWAIALAVGAVNGGKDNYWTAGGHFIAITDYDPETNKIYVRDPAGRRTGYQNPDKLKFDCNCMWIICEEY